MSVVKPRVRMTSGVEDESLWALMAGYFAVMGTVIEDPWTIKIEFTTPYVLAMFSSRFKGRPTGHRSEGPCSLEIADPVQLRKFANNIMKYSLFKKDKLRRLLESLDEPDIRPVSSRIPSVSVVLASLSMLSRDYVEIISCGMFMACGKVQVQPDGTYELVLSGMTESIRDILTRTWSPTAREQLMVDDGLDQRGNANRCVIVAGLPAAHFLRRLVATVRTPPFLANDLRMVHRATTEKCRWKIEPERAAATRLYLRRRSGTQFPVMLDDNNGIAPLG